MQSPGASQEWWRIGDLPHPASHWDPEGLLQLREQELEMIHIHEEICRLELELLSREGKLALDRFLDCQQRSRPARPYCFLPSVEGSSTTRRTYASVTIPHSPVPPVALRLDHPNARLEVYQSSARRRAA